MLDSALHCSQTHELLPRLLEELLEHQAIILGLFILLLQILVSLVEIFLNACDLIISFLQLLLHLLLHLLHNEFLIFYCLSNDPIVILEYLVDLDHHDLEELVHNETRGDVV